MRTKLLVFALVCGCESQPSWPAATSTECALRIPVESWSKIDFLFVIDDTTRMATHAEALRRRLQLAAELIRIGCGDRAWVHVGVVGGGGDGVLRPACGGQPFLDLNSYRASDNLSGVSLRDALACAGTLGTGGTGIALLESAVRALTVENTGFWRERSYRIVIFLAGGDDGSIGDAGALGAALVAGAPDDTFVGAFVDGPAPRFGAALAGRKLTSLAPLTGSDDQPLTEPFQCIISHHYPSCLWSPPANPADPDCVVEQVRYSLEGSTNSVLLPRCDRAGGSLPCWRVADEVRCPPPS
jgi:hypothetical protein